MTVDMNSLGQVLDTTWGRSSTPMTASMSVKMRILDAERISVTFVTNVNAGSERELIQVRRQCEEQAASIVKQVLTNVKSNYKELEGTAIKLTEVGNPEVSIELLGGSPWNPVRSLLFKSTCLVEYS